MHGSCARLARCDRNRARTTAARRRHISHLQLSPTSFNFHDPRSGICARTRGGRWWSRPARINDRTASRLTSLPYNHTIQRQPGRCLNCRLGGAAAPRRQVFKRAKNELDQTKYAAGPSSLIQRKSIARNAKANPTAARPPKRVSHSACGARLAGVTLSVDNPTLIAIPTSRSAKKGRK